MSKAPSFNFYSSDFMTGTALMNYEQKGKYITLLCLQHQVGHLSEEDMLIICGSYDKRIFEKFQIDENGFYYNDRLDKETAKRQKFVESRRNNLNSKNTSEQESQQHTDTHMGTHMATRMENANEIEIEINNSIGNDNIDIDINTDNQLRCIGGKLGQGVVYLTENQESKLLDTLGLDGFDVYVKRLADYIIRKNAKINNHFETIMKWYYEDTKV